MKKVTTFFKEFLFVANNRGLRLVKNYTKFNVDLFGVSVFSILSETYTKCFANSSGPAGQGI